ncbi:hypothetical protein [Undibacterium sp. TC9W]|uniref:hypothetical protein n=1 Tax=Undibacterium sp. TC9W TaxID=3413053 RepID=UPI003BF3245B
MTKAKFLNSKKSDPTEVIKKLHLMKPVKSKLNETNVERWCMKISNFMLIFATLMLIILGGFVLWNNYVRPLNETEKAVLLLFAALTMTLPLFSMILSIVSNIWALYSFQNNSLEYFLNEIKNDHQHLDELTSFAKVDLEDALKIIQLKITRIRNRMGFFIGGPDKVALFSLATMAWSILKEFSAKEKNAPTLSILQSGFSLTTLLQYAAAFFAGIAIGAILLHRHLQRYIYQTELLEMAIARKEQNLPVEDN